MSLIAHPDSGLLLVASPSEGGTGLLAASLACCCDCPCCPCEQYVATVGDVTGGFGDQCNEIEGTYTLNKQVNCGPWTGRNQFQVAGTLSQFTDSDGLCYMRLRIGPALAPAQADYIVRSNTWNCAGCNTMTLDYGSVTGICTWPDTVQVCCNDY